MVKTRAQVEEDNRLSPYRTTRKLKLAISSAQSQKFNPRNHENNWHPVWGHVMHELLRPYDNLIPYVQYAQWRSEDGVLPEMSHRKAATPDNAGDLNAREDTEESASQTDIERPESPTPIDRVLRSRGSNPPATPNRAANRNAAYYAHSDEEYEPRKNNRSTAPTKAQERLMASTSSNRTIMVPMDDEYPDLAVLHSVVKEMSKRGTAKFSKDKVKVRNAKRFDLQTVHLCPALLGEMKRNVSRHEEIEDLANQRVEENENLIRRRIFNAIDQMSGYLGTFFKRYPNIHEIVALVTAGPYWQYKLYQKEAFFVFWDDENMKFQGDILVMRHKSTAFAASFGQKVYELGTEESDEALTQMRDRYLDHLSKE
ncbi:hypothetical protein LENED_011208 [Lentinula edodes]|uniref:Uncharacterized protein n=1 Tax=Lentinula edodes TaxID=5353 RepID=A0A1Q3EPE6_LENED|nr:uncharacterized protein C8R40DRAFT_1168733 [Lentinula edodes]KAH7877374.1 hypothetical protein C8R40DRAFT_1168733 [Lentinula edodes]GAW09078.1 hypothetical protein LENED_011208 [Lentinula edodes]